MATQPEYALEEALLTQLEGMEYQRVRIDNEAAMLANLKRQLEIHNGNMGVFAQKHESDYSRTSPPESWGTGIRANSPMSRSRSIGSSGLPNS